MSFHFISWFLRCEVATSKEANRVTRGEIKYFLRNCFWSYREWPLWNIYFTNVNGNVQIVITTVPSYYPRIWPSELYLKSLPPSFNYISIWQVVTWSIYCYHFRSVKYHGIPSFAVVRVPQHFVFMLYFVNCYLFFLSIVGCQLVF